MASYFFFQLTFKGCFFFLIIYSKFLHDLDSSTCLASSLLISLFFTVLTDHSLTQVSPLSLEHSRHKLGSELFANALHFTRNALSPTCSSFSMRPSLDTQPKKIFIHLQHTHTHTYIHFIFTPHTMP